MNTKGSYITFCNDRILQTHFSDNINLQLKRIGKAVARVFFVDVGYAEVPVPVGFIITDRTNGVVKFHGREEYYLGWGDNYSFLFNIVQL